MSTVHNHRHCEKCDEIIKDLQARVAKLESSDAIHHTVYGGPVQTPPPLPLPPPVVIPPPPDIPKGPQF